MSRIQPRPWRLSIEVSVNLAFLAANIPGLGTETKDPNKNSIDLDARPRTTKPVNPTSPPSLTATIKRQTNGERLAETASFPYARKHAAKSSTASKTPTKTQIF